jgi:two-component system, chemotaxis family, chemotaxis protein CheY
VGTRGPVLLVDDDPDLREALQLVLEMNGYAVQVARDGADALARLSEAPLPSVVLLDVMMPGMNGVEFRERQRADPRLRDLPVVLLTGAGPRAVDPALIDGAVVLRKPFDFDQLFSLLDRLCAPPAEAT